MRVLSIRVSTAVESAFAAWEAVAALLITTEAMIADRPEKKPAPMGGAGGGMGGMGDMDF